MSPFLKREMLEVYRNGLAPPFQGGLRKWAETFVDLPEGTQYSIPGPVNFSLFPNLIKPAAALSDPLIMQVNLCMATQVGKSMLSEIYIPYIIKNVPGPMARIFHDQQVSDLFTSDRLVPLLKNCAPIKPLLQYDRFSTGKKGIRMPHMSIVCGSSNTALQHGMSLRYFLGDELHQWDVGQFRKFLARTTAFAGRRKIICASQPGRTGGEWEQICYNGMVYEWHWLCPQCSTRQPYYWSKEKADNKGYGGFNWDTILMPDGETTDIERSCKTTWLECINCDCRVHDTPVERRYLNDTSDYALIRNNGDPAIITFMAPAFVNVGISFASKAAEYMIAKRTKKITGLDELMTIFVEQTLGKFYKREDQPDMSNILTEMYEKDKLDNKEWFVSMGVDVQRTGGVKYYVVRAWSKKGNESRRIAFGIARTFEELEALRIKHNVLPPMLHIDSGDGPMTSTIYQECLLHGSAVRLKEGVAYICWTPTKGDQKVSYKHKDNITRLYSEVSNQDSQFPVGHKLKGIPAPLILFSNFSLKTILNNLRDNRVEGVKWLIDVPDEEYDKQIYSEGLVDVVDKKSGNVTQRWMQIGTTDNHYYDCEVLNLLAAMRAKAFSATKIDENMLKKIIDSQKPAPV